jgi:hypothetical protein
MGWIDCAYSPRNSAPGIVLVQLDPSTGDVRNDVDTAQMIVVVEVFARSSSRD